MYTERAEQTLNVKNNNNKKATKRLEENTGELLL